MFMLRPWGHLSLDRFLLRAPCVLAGCEPGQANATICLKITPKAWRFPRGWGGQRAPACCALSTCPEEHPVFLCASLRLGVRVLASGKPSLWSSEGRVQTQNERDEMLFSMLPRRGAPLPERLLGREGMLSGQGGSLSEHCPHQWSGERKE